ncbi:MAG: hypothetical protein JJU20_03005 [Opitutales bacterium]|nr:hypothetical protein [Opitutales bacterium]
MDSDSIDKVAVLNALMKRLTEELDEAIAASRDAAAYATNEESRAESKWDTQGLEASYLAAGQAGQAREWAQAMQTIRAQRESLLAKKERVLLGALVECEVDGETDCYFITPAAGGQDLSIEGHPVTTITMQSPMAQKIQNRKEGDSFILSNGLKGMIKRIR